MRTASDIYSGFTAESFLLLTRSLLSLGNSKLACIRPIASIHAEPGSNSNSIFRLCASPLKGVGGLLGQCASPLKEPAARPAALEGMLCASLNNASIFSGEALNNASIRTVLHKLKRQCASPPHPRPYWLIELRLSCYRQRDSNPYE